MKQPVFFEHELKATNPHFTEQYQGRKTFEFRVDDRVVKFAKNHILKLREYDDETDTYSGRYCKVRVTHILREFPGMKEGYVVMSTQLESIYLPAHNIEINRRKLTSFLRLMTKRDHSREKLQQLREALKTKNLYIEYLIKRIPPDDYAFKSFECWLSDYHKEIIINRYRKREAK